MTMTALPDRPPAGLGVFSGARVLLMGTGTHAPGAGLPDVPAIGRTLTDLHDAFVRYCGLPEAALRVVTDPPTAQVMGQEIAEVAEQADGLLLVYYIGHGLVSEDAALYLAASQSEGARAGRRLSRVEVTALPYATLRRLVMNSRARAVVVILDCCFSGKALDGLSDSVDEVANLAQITGGFLLTAAGREEVALAPAGASHTAFSGHLLRLLRSGDPHRPAWLTLQEVYRHLAVTLPASGFPKPRSRSDGTIGELVLAPNPAYRAQLTPPAMSPPVVGAGLGVSPYKGLAAYEAADEAWFHGRDTLVTKLVDSVTHRLDDPRVLMVTGASGSGKSSLLRAGLLPAVGRGRLGVPGSSNWPRRVCTPTADPIGMLRTLFDGLPEAPGARLVLVVDQFEETFTLCDRESDRRAFVRTLCELTQGRHGPPALVVLAVRADFYGRCTAYPQLGSALEGAQVVVRAMSTAQTREAIEIPARAAGLGIEPGLVELLLADLGAASPAAADSASRGQGPGQQPGRLPLLSHALRETWRYQQQGYLTVEGYRRTGGIHGALAVTAEAVLARFDDAGQDVARQLLVSLVRIGDGSDDTRRRIGQVDLLDRTRDPALAATVLNAFSADNARLVTLDGSTVEITHDALLRAWPRLRSWIDDDRAGLLLRQHLVDAAQQWRTERDPSSLYSGTRLALATEWATPQRRADLPAAATEFLDASTTHGRRRRWRTRALAAALAVLLGGSLVGAAIAVAQGRRADAQQELAATQQRSATGRSLTLQAELLRDAQPATALRLGVAAMAVSADTPTRTSLVTTVSRNRYTASLVDGRDEWVTAVAFSPDGRTVASAIGADVVLWDVTVTPPKRVATLTGLSSDILAVAFSRDRRSLATISVSRRLAIWDVTAQGGAKLLTTTASPAVPASLADQYTASLAFSADGRTLATADGVLTLWDVTDPAAPRVLAAPAGSLGSLSVAISPDGRTVATAGVTEFRTESGERRRVTPALWDVSRPAAPLRTATFGEDEFLIAVAFGPDGLTLATGDSGGTAGLWDVTDRTAPQRTATLEGHTDPINAVAFSPDGLILATGSIDNSAGLWDISYPDSPRRTAALSHSGTVTAVAFSPDGQRLATGSYDGAAVLWQVNDGGTPRRVANLGGQSGKVPGLAFSRDGRSLAVTGKDGRLGRWEIIDRAAPKLTETLTNPPDNAYAVQFTPDGQALAVLHSQGAVALWNSGTRTTTTITGDHDVNTVALSPDGRTAAIGMGKDSITELWDITDRSHPRRTATLRGLPDRPTSSVNRETFSADGRTLAVANGPDVMLWDITDRTAPQRISDLIGHTNLVYDIAFSHDGHAVATGGGDQTVALWDITDRAAPRRTAVLSGHVNFVVTVAFSTDDNILAASANDSTVQFWDVTDRAGPRLVSTLLTDVRSTEVVLSPDGVTMAGFSLEDDAELFDIGRLAAIVKDPVTAACKIVGTGLSRTEWAAYVPSIPYRETCPA